jgi:hypothetical protein
LERRYRGLLRLLPADHRAARGEELLGLLLDLDAGRTRPSVRQSLGVFGLALRLRLADTASLVLAAFLVAHGTAIVATLHDISTGAVTVSVDSRSAVHNVTLALLIPAVLRLATALAWILGARRTALAVFAALLVYSAVTAGGPGGLLRVDLVVLVALGAATALRWPTPGPRGVLLATVPLAMLLWTFVAARYIPGFGLLFVTAAIALLGGAAGLVLHRRSRSGPQDRPTPATG